MENTQKDTKFSLSGSYQKSREYIEARLKLLSLKITEKTSKLIASLMVDLTKAVFALFVLFFFSLALGFYLSELLGSNSLGFLATGAIFIIFIIIISLLEPRLEKYLINVSIRKVLKTWHEEDQESKDQEFENLATNDEKGEDKQN